MYKKNYPQKKKEIKQDRRNENTVFTRNGWHHILQGELGPGYR